jgi:peptidoglycan/LPS O-acetylase OafA/YrhL
MKYRSEIDGLRALAVVPVILYHAGISLFSGGFVGVDVFFVISGYLISTIILEEIGEGSFSLAHFYERRARRILPALFLVITAILPFAWLWLSPADAKDFSKSLVAVSIFASNILFWRTSGYFDSAAEIKPLIHTWSLAVEEQYYVFFPLFIILTRRWSNLRTVGVLALISVMSLAVAQYGAFRFPSAAFYLLPTRVWELLLGVFVAYYFADNHSKKHAQGVSETASLLGFFMIAYSIFMFNDKTVFPGINALLPTVGAALIVIFATSQTLVGKILSSKGFVAIGLVSYSAYLWHQPLLALARQRVLDEPGNAQLAVIIIFSFVLAYLSWKFVERPFRKKGVLARKEIFAFSAVGGVALVGIGLFGYATQGFVGRYDQAQRDFFFFFENSIPELNYITKQDIFAEYRLQCNFYDLDSYRSGNSTMIPRARIADECFKKDGAHTKTAFIWGDSHAQHLYPGLTRTLPADWQILQVASSGCKPSIEGEDSNNDYCVKSNWFALKQIIASSPDVVIVAQNTDHDLAYMDLVGQRLRSSGVQKIVFFRSNATLAEKSAGHSGDKALGRHPGVHRSRTRQKSH